MARPARRLYRKRIKRRIYKKIPRNVVGNSLNVNCEYFDVLRLKALAAGIGFWNGFQIPSFRNIKDMLLNSQSYLKFSPLYGKLQLIRLRLWLLQFIQYLNYLMMLVLYHFFLQLFI